MNNIKSKRDFGLVSRQFNNEQTLLIGIGNDSRADDGLGWAFLKKVEASGLFKGTIHYRYQLQIEDAELITHYKQLLFVDAFNGQLNEGFSCTEIFPAANFNFSTHKLDPQTLLYLANELYGHYPKACGLWIEGRCWGLKTGMSEIAKENLEAALHFFAQ